MVILGIETSCDETSIAILEAKNSHLKILSNIVASQVKLHARYGGVYPSLAKREHQRNLPLVFNKALRKAGFANSKFQIPNSKQIQNLKIKNIDLIGVTAGPGLEPCLWQGINFAKDLARKLKVPLVPINHLEAHILADFVGKSQISNLKYQIFPAICLVVSGGHTGLVLMKDIGRYRLIGETRDDAAGECFDKVARILGLGYPGGPAIAALAAKFQTPNSKPQINPKFQIQLPRPMIDQKNYDFSFSGLKTAVLYDFKKRPEKVRKSKWYIQEMAREVQQAIIDVLIQKTIRAAKEYKARSIIIGGGVTANKELRRQLREKINKELPNIQYLIPGIQFCTDNAAMVAVSAYFNWIRNKNKPWPEIKAEANLKI